MVGTDEFIQYHPQVRNGATVVKVDKIDTLKDNSPALLIQGMRLHTLLFKLRSVHVRYVQVIILL